MAPPGDLLLDRLLPSFDVTTIQRIVVDASPLETYHAIGRADIGSNPITRALSFTRDLPNWIGRRRRREPEPRKVTTFNDIVSDESGWVVLADEAGVELVVGLVGRFWDRGYGTIRVAAEEFSAFDRPGFAKLAVSLSVRRLGGDRTLLTYEARTQTTDLDARKHFRRYWRVIGLGAGILMRMALRSIRLEAERASRRTRDGRPAAPAGV